MTSISSADQSSTSSKRASARAAVATDTHESRLARLRARDQAIADQDDKALRETREETDGIEPADRRLTVLENRAAILSARGDRQDGEIAEFLRDATALLRRF